MTLRVVLGTVTLAVAALAMPALAETWKMTGALTEKSAGSCDRTVGIYTFDTDGKSLTVTNVNGKQGTSAVAADGTVKFDFRSPSGASLRVAGNVPKHDLSVMNERFGCTWKLSDAN